MVQNSVLGVTILLSRIGELFDRSVIPREAVSALGYKPYMHMPPKQSFCVTLTDSTHGLVHPANVACYAKQIQQGRQEASRRRCEHGCNLFVP